MDQYFPLILTANLLLLLVIWRLVNAGWILDRTQKSSFSLVIVLTALIASDEFLTVLVDGVPGLRYLNILVNAGLLGLSPVLSVAAIGTMKTRSKLWKLVWIPLNVNALCLLTGNLFRVNEANVYSRQSLFWVYPVTCLACVAALMLHAYSFSRQYQFHNSGTLLLTGVYLVISCGFQWLRPTVHIAWLCISIAILLHYIYYTDFIQQIDPLTGLLNRRSFDSSLHLHRQRVGGIVVMDINGFKQINDTYGHLTGDVFLRCFSQCLLQVYSRCGHCYRFGGDEFCVLLKKDAGISAAELERELKCALLQNNPFDTPLTFAAGYSPVVSSSDSSDLQRALEEADRKMYCAKTAASSAHPSDVPANIR